MNYGNKNFIINSVMILLMIIVLTSTYYFLYQPLNLRYQQLQKDFNSTNSTLQQLRVLEGRQKQYEAELLEYKRILDRYQLFATEYGTFPKVLMMLGDIERRVGVRIDHFIQTQESIDMTIAAKYNLFQDFLTELENIDFFYDCNEITITGEQSKRFSFKNIDLVNVNLIADFESILIDNVEQKTDIEILIEELGLEDVVVTP